MTPNVNQSIKPQSNIPAPITFPEDNIDDAIKEEKPENEASK